MAFLSFLIKLIFMVFHSIHTQWSLLFISLSILSVKLLVCHGHTNTTAVSDSPIIEWKVLLVVLLAGYFLLCLCLLLHPPRWVDENSPPPPLRTNFPTMVENKKKNSYSTHKPK